LAQDLALSILLRIITVGLFSGLLSLVLFHIANHLKYPKKQNTYSNALYVSLVVGGFVLITGILLLLAPSLGESVGLRVFLVLANMGILVSMIKYLYKTGWKNAFYGWGLSIIAMLFLGVLVGIFVGVMEQLF
jgi:MFS family permease